MSWDHEPDGLRQVKRGFAIGAGLGALVVFWLWLARPPDDALSVGGFNVAGGPGVAIAFDRKGRSGPSYTESAGASGGSPAVSALPFYGGAPSSPASSAAAPAAPAGTSAAPAAPEAAGAAAAPAPSAAEMGAAGLPTDAAGLRDLGQRKGLLSAVFTRLIDHPRLLGALFNNTLVVDAVMGREVSQRNCSDSSALAATLANPQSEQMTKLLPLVQSTLSHPAAAAAFAGSEMASRMLACPSVQSLVKDPTAVASIVQANPGVLSLVADPRVAQAVADNPQAGSVLTGLQASLSGAGGAP